MYCHPHAFKKWAKAMKPQATQAQIEQARIMRAAKIAKRIFESRQASLFGDEVHKTPSPKKTENRMAPGIGLTFA
jgi:hypothetical protein